MDEQGFWRRVSFVGRVDGVEDYLRASDVFAFPSVFEALGISLDRSGRVRACLRWGAAPAGSWT